jgi:phosphatidylglycerophosphatase A
MRYWYTKVATLGPVGYMLAPGTMATLITLPFVFLFQELFVWQWLYLLAIMILAVWSVWVIHRTVYHIRRFDDPSEIVLDESVGCLLTFWGIGLSLQTVLVGFILFRFFDIFKLGGIRHFEKLPGAWGIVIDDLVAALLSNILLRILVCFI